jgi:hypothetical protein
MIRFKGHPSLVSAALDALNDAGIAASIVDEYGTVEVAGDVETADALLSSFGYRRMAGSAGGSEAARSGPLPDLDDFTACIAWAAAREFKVEKVLRVDGRNPSQAEVDIVNALGKKGMKRAVRLRAAVIEAFAGVNGEEVDDSSRD